MNNNDVNKNDWFVANLTSPNKTLGDFSQEGLNPSNTQLLSREEYAKNDKIKSTFKTADGKFDNKQFNDFYDISVQTYNQFANNQYDQNLLNNSYFSPENVFTVGPVKRRTNTITFSRDAYNPQGDMQGILGFTEATKNPLSVRELAQTQKIFNTTTNKFEDATPNDNGFFGTLFGDTAVLAVYDEDGFHTDPNSGRQVRHRKGENKLNENGKYFYETLGTRSVYGKNVLSPWDVITVDGSYANKFDFMDSDDRRKSLIGSLMKTAVMTAPYIYPPTRALFGGLGAAKVLFADILPAFTKAGMGIISNDGLNDSSLYKLMNVIEAKGKTLTGSTSDYANEHMFAMENIIALTGDVFGQLAQQNFVAKLPGYLSQSRKEVAVLKELNLRGDDISSLSNKLRSASFENRSRILRDYVQGDEAIHKIINNWDKWGSEYGRTMGQLFMTGMSSAGVLEAADANGLDNRDAAFLLLGTTVGLHKVMTSELGELALKGIGMDEVGQYVKKVAKRQTAEFAPLVNSAKSALGGELKGAVGETVSTAGTASAKKSAIATWFDKGKSIGSKLGIDLSDLNSLQSKMLAEGLEEVSEEFVQDGFQQGYNLFRALGWTSTDASKTEAFTLEDSLERYALAFIGGGIGGAVYGLSGLGGSMHANLTKDLSDDVVTAYLNGYGEEYEAYLEKAWKDGVLGSTELSAEYEKIDFSLNPDKTYKPVISSTSGLSQNDVTYNMMKSHLSFVRNAIFQENDLSNRSLTALYNYRNSKLLEFEYTTPIKKDIEKITQQIVTLKGKIEEAKGGIKSGKVADEAKTDIEIAPLEADLKGLQEELKMIVSGSRYDYYLKHALFAVQPELFKKFGIKDKQDFAFSKYGKPYNKLNAEESADVDDEYEIYSKMSKSDQLQKATYELEQYLEKFSPKVEELKDYAASREELINKSIQTIELLHATGQKLKDKGYVDTDTPINNLLSKLSGDPSTTGNLTGTELAFQANVNEQGLFGVAYQTLLESLRSSKYSDPVFNKLIIKYLENTIPTLKLATSSMGPSTDADGNRTFSDLEYTMNPLDYFKNVVTDGLYASTIRFEPESHLAKLMEEAPVLLESALDLKNLLQMDNLYNIEKTKANIQELVPKVKEIIEKFISDNAETILDNFEDDVNTSGVKLTPEQQSALLKDFSEALQKSTNDALNAYTYALQGGEVINNRLDGVFEFNPSRDEDSIAMFNFAKEALELIESNNSKPNPLFEIAKDMAKLNNQDRAYDLLDIMSKEYSNVLTKHKADEYVIENPLNEMEMEYLNNILDKAEAVVTATIDYNDNTLSDNQIIGYNSALNAAVNKGAMGDGYTERPVMNIGTGTIIQQDLKSLRGRIDILLNLNKYNRNGNIREMRSVANRMMALYSESFTKDSDNYNILQKAGLDLTKLDIVLNNSDTINNTISVLDRMRNKDNSAVMSSDEDVLRKTREEHDKIAQTVYEIVNIDNDPTVVIPKIVEQLRRIDTYAPPLNFSSDTVNLDYTQKALFLGKTISVDPKQFYKDFAGDLNSDVNELSESKYAPFYGQELALSFAYWSVFSSKRNIDSYKLFANKLLPDNSLPKEKWEETNKGSEIYHSLTNAISIFGIPGAGKSTAVINTLIRMIDQYGMKTAAFVPYESQTKNLVDLPGLMNKDFTINGFLENLLGSELFKEIENTVESFDFTKSVNDVKNNTADSVISFVTGVNDNKEWFQANLNHKLVKELLAKDVTITVNGEVPNVLVIDEATQIQSAYMQLLDILITKHNTLNPNKQISLILTGDLEQNGAKMIEPSQKVKYMSSMLGLNFLSTPVLSQSLRSDFNLLNNNIAKLRSLKRVMMDAFDEGVPKDSIVSNIVKADIEFEYSEDTEHLIGYKVYDEVEVDDIAKLYKLKNADGAEPSVVVITDKSDEHIEQITDELVTRHNIDKDKINIIAPEKVQGLEFDYVAIDLAANNEVIDDRSAASKLSNQHQMMYTLLSRSRVGSIINKDALASFSNIVSTDKDVFPQMIKLDGEEIEKYKNFTIDSIKNTNDKLSDFESNITNANKRKTDSPTFIPPKNISNNVKESLLKSVADNLSGSIKEEDVLGQPIKLVEDETQPIVYSSNVNSTLKVTEKDGKFKVVGEVLPKDVDPLQREVFNYENIGINEAHVYNVLRIHNTDATTAELVDLSKQIYTALKNDITAFYATDTDKTLREYLSRSDINPLLTDYLSNSDVLNNIDNYRLALVTKEFNPEHDRDFSTSEHKTSAAPSTNSTISYYALVSPNTILTKNNTPVYDHIIYLGALSNINNQTIQNKLKGVEKSLSEVKAAHVKYLSDNKLSSYNRSFFFTDADPREVLTPISNIVIRPLEDKQTPLTYKEMVDNYSQFTFSKPLIGNEDIIADIGEEIDAQFLEDVTNPLSESNKKVFNLKGKTFVLATTDKSLTTAEKMLSKLGREMEEARANGGFYPGTVKIIIMNSKGTSFKEWFDANNELVVKYKKAEENNTVSKEDLRMMSNEYAAARMLARMINIASIKTSEKSDTPSNDYISKILLSKIDGYNPAKGGNPDYFYNSLRKVVGIIGTITTDMDINEFLNRAFGTDGFNLNSYINRDDIKAKVKIRNTKDANEYYNAIEYFMALDLMNLLKTNDTAGDIKNDAGEIIAKGYSKQLLNNFVQAMRVGISGGKSKKGTFEPLFNENSKEKENFITALDYMFTTPPAGLAYKPLFPDGIWPDLYFKKDRSHANSEYIPFHEASGDGSNLIGNFRLNDRKLKIDTSKFDLSNTKVDSFKSKEDIEKEQLKVVTSMADDAIAKNKKTLIVENEVEYRNKIIQGLLNDINYLNTSPFISLTEDYVKDLVPKVNIKQVIDQEISTITNKYDNINSDSFSYTLTDQHKLDSNGDYLISPNTTYLNLDIQYEGVKIGTMRMDTAYDVQEVRYVDLDSLFINNKKPKKEKTNKTTGEQQIELNPDSTVVHITDDQGNVDIQVSKISDADIVNNELAGYTLDNPLTFSFDGETGAVTVDRSNGSTLTRDVLVNGEKKGIFVTDLDTGKSTFEKQSPPPVRKVDKKIELMENIQSLFKPGVLESDPKFTNVQKLIDALVDYDPNVIDKQIDLSRTYLKARAELVINKTDPDTINNFELYYREFAQSKCL